MEENIMEVMRMSLFVFLFVFALTAGIFRYNYIDSVTKQMVDLNVVDRRGTTADGELKPEDVERLADYSEIILSILNVRNATLANENSYKIVINRGDKRCECVYSGDFIQDIIDLDDLEESATDGISDVTTGETPYRTGHIVLTYISSASKRVQEYSLDEIMGISPNNSGSNLVEFLYDYLALNGDGELERYKVDYTEDSITYTLN